MAATKAQQSWADAQGFQKQCIAIDAQLKRVSKENFGRAQKTTRIAKLNARKTPSENALKSALETFAKIECRTVCDGVMKHLPRELRDLVHEYIVTPDYFYTGQQYFTNSGVPCENERDAHHWNIEYVGEKMLPELAEMWYRVSLFYFWQRNHHGQIIERFMTFDPWGIGILPHMHVSRVRFDIGDGVYYGLASERPRVNRVPADYAARLTSPFKILARFKFPNRVQFLIRIQTLGSLQSGVFANNQFREMIEEIVNDLQKLRAGDHRFRVDWVELDNLEFTSNAEELSYEFWNGRIQQTMRKMRFDTSFLE